MGRFSTDSGGGNFTPAPVGVHIARCFRIIDLGTQHGEYQGKPTRRNQVIISWELPDELVNIEGEERPIITSKFYTNSMGEKANLRQHLESWRGRVMTQEGIHRFDLQAILGVPCMLTIVAGNNGNTKVAGVSGLPRSLECPPQINKNFVFWLEEYDEDKFEEISEGLQGIIKKSEEWQAIQSGAPATIGESRSDFSDDSDIPF